MLPKGRPQDLAVEGAFVITLVEGKKWRRAPFFGCRYFNRYFNTFIPNRTDPYGLAYYSVLIPLDLCCLNSITANKHNAWTKVQRNPELHWSLLLWTNCLLLTAILYTKGSPLLIRYKLSAGAANWPHSHPWNWRRATPNNPFHPTVQRRDQKNSKRQLKDWL